MMKRLDDSKRVWMLSALLLLMVFLAGSLTGAATLDGSKNPGTAQRISVRALQGLGALDLSPGQRASVDQIVTRHQPAVDSIIQATMNDLSSLIDSVHIEVRALLSPDQIAALDSMVAAGPRTRAVRQTLGPDGEVIDVDTIR